MKKASHHALGHLLYQTLAAEGICLDRELFVLGNLLPDYMPELILFPHFTARCQREIGLFSDVLASQSLDDAREIPAEYALRLGILCHYIADYYCFAHSRAFGKNMRKHGAYERGLNEHFRMHYSAKECALPPRAPVRCTSGRDVARSVARLRHGYLAAPRSYETDLRYAFTACLDAIRALVALSAAREETRGVRFRFVPFAAERYAYGSGVCRRRIVPRKAWCVDCPT